MNMTSSEKSSLVARWKRVVAEVQRDAADCGRAADSVRLVCASKTQSAEAIDTLLCAGATIFGENRVQEAQEKWPRLKKTRPGLRLHLIGPLQTNKADAAMELFDVIETVDRFKLAEHIADRVHSRGLRQPDLFVQINTGDEPQKSGIGPADADAFIRRCREELGLRLRGLMCIPPAQEQAAPHFALLATIAARNQLPDLSMGMSSDFGAGIQLGATFVRIGTAIFGERRRSMRSLGG